MYGLVIKNSSNFRCSFSSHNLCITLAKTNCNNFATTQLLDIEIKRSFGIIYNLKSGDILFMFKVGDVTKIPQLYINCSV